MTSSSETVLTLAETIALVTKMTEAIYVAHVHCGKAHVSIAFAVEMASTVVGAVQSEGVISRVADAIADPKTCLDQLNQQRLNSNDKVNLDQLDKIDRLATAMEREKGQRGTK